MLERIIELLVSIAVAAAGASGIDTAMNTPHGVGPDTDSVAAKVAWAKQQAAERRADVATLVEEEPEEVEGTAADAALEALERVMDSAPEAASDGLNQAWESVSSGGNDEPETTVDEASDAAPVEVPAGPPAEIPAGPPDGVPPADAGRP